MSGPGQSDYAPTRRDTYIEGIDMHEMARAVWRRRHWIIVPVVAAGCLAAVWLWTTTPLYRASATVLIESQETAFTRPERAGEAVTALDQETVASHEQLIRSTDLGREVVERVDLASHPEFAGRGGSPVSWLMARIGLGGNEARSNDTRVLRTYFDRLSVYQIDRSRVLAIEFSSADPELAARVANALADGYIEMQRTAKRDMTVEASDWLGEQIDRLRVRVDDAERRVEAYRREAGLTGSGRGNENGPTLSGQELAELTSQLAGIRTDKSDAQARARMIRELLDAGSPLEASDVLNSPLVQRLDEQKARIRSQLAELSSTLGPRHPRMQQLQAELGDLRSQTREEAERIVRALENDARVAAARESELLTNIETVRVSTADSQEQEVELRALEREARSQRDLLESMLARFGEASVRDTFAGLPADARIISRAAPPPDPYFPRRLPILLAVMMAAGAISGGLVVTNELIRAGSGPAPAGAAPVAARTEPEWPPVAIVPHDAEPDDPDRHDRLAEIAQAICDRAGDDEAAVVLVTSVRRMGALSDVVTRLGRRVAEGAERVVIVDTAFGEGLTGKGDGATDHGLGEILTGKGAFESALYRDRISRLHILPAGTCDVDPLLLVSSDRMETAIKALRQTYDVILVLAPAINRRAEARLLARRAGFGVLVTRGDGQDTATQRACARLHEAGIDEVATVNIDGLMDDGRGAAVPRAA